MRCSSWSSTNSTPYGVRKGRVTPVGDPNLHAGTLRLLCGLLREHRHNETQHRACDERELTHEGCSMLNAKSPMLNTRVGHWALGLEHWAFVSFDCRRPGSTPHRASHRVVRQCWSS